MRARGVAMSVLTLSQLESLRRAWTTLAPDDEDLVPADLKRVLEMLGFAPTDDELRHLVIEAANEHPEWADGLR